MSHLFNFRQKYEAGFVLPTSLIMLALLSMMALGVYFGSLSSQKMSAAAQRTTQAYYYAETAANYMQWVLSENAEMDSYASYAGNSLRTASGNCPTGDANALFCEPLNFGPNTFEDIGDDAELRTFRVSPGPVGISDTMATALPSGQTYGSMVMYFDNSPIDARAIKWPDAETNPPTFEDISVKLPRYIKIDIDASGNIVPTIPAVPHADPPVVGDDIPKNGAVVWLTAGVIAGTEERDTQIVPLDTYTFGGPNTAQAAGPTTTYPNGYSGSAYPAVLASCSSTVPALASACSSYTGTGGGWLTTDADYRFVIYALGYVNGKAVRLVRKTW